MLRSHGNTNNGLGGVANKVLDNSRTDVMHKGYAGLPRKQMLDGTARVADDSAAAEPSRSYELSRHGNLHVVPVDRRKRGREEISEIEIHAAPGGRIYYASKRAFDLLAASAAIIFLSPFIVAIVVSAYLSSGSAFFRHRRVGQGGKFFDCIKF